MDCTTRESRIKKNIKSNNILYNTPFYTLLSRALYNELALLLGFARNLDSDFIKKKIFFSFLG